MGQERENYIRIAGGQNKHFTPYFKQTYFPSKKVMQLYKTPDITFETPAFLKKEKAFTTQEELMTFLYDICQHNEFVKLEILARSLEGRDVPMLVFSTSHDDPISFMQKPTVWLQAQIHGDEPAAGESALVIAKRLAKGSLGEKYLHEMNIVIIPRMNPDSMYYFQRNSAAGLNGNRDHINLEMPELQAIHQAFNQYNPEVVIDAHEYGATPQFADIGAEGALKYHDVLLQTGKNLNIPEKIRKMSDEWFMKDAFQALDRQKLSYGTYYIVDKSEGTNPILHEGGVDAGTGRNTFALKPSFSILVETLGIGIGRGNFLRRVFGQVVTHEAILQTVYEKKDEIKRVVKEAREKISSTGELGIENGSIILDSKLGEAQEQTLRVIDIAKGKLIDIPVNYHSATHSTATLKRIRPNAYILPPAYAHIVKKLQLQGVKVERLVTEQTLDVECFEVVQREVINENDQPLSKLTTNVTTEKRMFVAGSFLIRSNQSRALIASLALEPEAKSSFFTQNFIPTYIGEELPLYRYMDNMDFPLVSL